MPILGPLLNVGRSLWGAARALPIRTGMAARALGGATRAAKAASRYAAPVNLGRGMSAAGRFAAEHYWTLDSILGKLNSLVDSFTHVITVKCVGGPAADLRRVYYLACAAAFGRFSRATTRVNGSYFEMSCSTDVTDKSVTITIGYNTALIGDAIRANTTDARTPLDVMFDGPDQFTVGRGWTAPFFTSKGAGSTYASVVAGQEIRGGRVVDGGGEKNVPPGLELGPETGEFGGSFTRPIVQWVVKQDDVLRLKNVPLTVFRPYALASPAVDAARELPSLSTDKKTRKFYMRRVVPPGMDGFTVVETRAGGRVPRLPDDGRVITTGETGDARIQPPRPPVDGIARGSLLALTVQALTAPGFLPGLPALTDTPLGSGGVYVNAPGATLPAQTPSDPTREEAPPPTLRSPGIIIQLPSIIGPIPIRVPLPQFTGAKTAPLLRDPLR